jgi:oligosaccharide repeat unit polymerase
MGSIFRDQKILNPMFVFMAVWAFMLFLSSLKLFTLFEVGDEYLGMMAVGFLAFFVGYSLYSYFKRNNSTNIKKYEQRTVVIYICCVAILLLLLIKFISVYSVVMQYGLAFIRKGLQTGELTIYAEDSVIMSMIWQLLVLPGRLALSVIVSVNFLEKKNQKPLMVLYIVIIFLSVLIDGGRIVIVYLMIHLFFALYYLRAKRVNNVNNSEDLVRKRQTIRIKSRSSKRVLSVIGLCAIGGIAFYYATIARSGDSALIHLYFYGSISPIMFEIWSKIVDGSGLVGYGLASLNGFLSPILYFMKLIMGYAELPFYWGDIVNMIYNTDAIWQQTSLRSQSNAYVSLFWFFYLDGRIFGIIIGMFLYGFLSKKVFTRFMTEKTDISLCFLLLWIQGLLFSGVRLQFAVMPYALAFIFIMMFFKKKSEGRVQ